MKIDIRRELIVPLPIDQVVIELTPQEWHDLQVVARIPTETMKDAIAKSGRAGNKINTFDVYTLLQKLREAR